jgi:hypothetical protein
MDRRGIEGHLNRNELVLVFMLGMVSTLIITRYGQAVEIVVGKGLSGTVLMVYHRDDGQDTPLHPLEGKR